MAPSRAPLTELGSQGHNRRKMASQQKKYGKAKGKVALLPSLWESTSGENNLVDEEKAHGKRKFDEEIEITDKLEGLAIAAHADPELKQEDVDSLQTEGLSGTRRAISSPPTRRSSRFPKIKTITPTGPTVTTALGLDVDVLLAESQTGVIKPFSKFADALIQDYDIQKLAEGSFGDVYKLFCRPDSSASVKERLEKIGGVVLKVIPLTAKTGEGSRKYTKVKEALGEIKILKALDSIHGFTRFRDVQIVRGKYPPSFVKAWRDHKDEDGDSRNRDPDEAFKPGQIFAILDMDDVGKELGSYDGLSIFQAYDTFWACAIVLAHGEAKVGFETRDMHVSNICLRPLDHSTSMDVSRSTVAQWPADQTKHLGHANVRVTLIDYTLSRAALDGSVAYTDLNRNLWLFKGPVCKEENFQARAYRQMNEVARAASDGRKPDWSKFFPATNLVWLEYLLETFLTITLFDEIVEGSNESCIAAQQEMRATLYSVLKALKVAIWAPNSGMKSAEGLLAAAVEKKWLSKEELDSYVEKIQL